MHNANATATTDSKENNEVNKPGVWKFCRRISTGSQGLLVHGASSTFILLAGSGSFVLWPTFLLHHQPINSYINWNNNATRGGSSHSHRQHARKMWWNSAVCFLSYFSGPTDTQTNKHINRHTHHNTSQPYWGEVIKNNSIRQRVSYYFYHRIPYTDYSDTSSQQMSIPYDDGNEDNKQQEHNSGTDRKYNH